MSNYWQDRCECAKSMFIHQKKAKQVPFKEVLLVKCADIYVTELCLKGSDDSLICISQYKYIYLVISNPTI